MAEKEAFTCCCCGKEYPSLLEFVSCGPETLLWCQDCVSLAASYQKLFLLVNQRRIEAGTFVRLTKEHAELNRKTIL